MTSYERKYSHQRINSTHNRHNDKSSINYYASHVIIAYERNFIAIIIYIATFNTTAIDNRTSISS
nr:MAG TPA: hypothetical protein [Caudoviricetes sp.]